MSDEADSRPSSKVARLIAEYDLEGQGARLEAQWTAEGDQRMSLRDLATHFNEQLVEYRLRDAGMDALESDVERIYRHLTDDEISAGRRADVRTRLEQNGIDVEALKRDFVTYQAVRSFLTEYRDAEYDHPSDTVKIEKDRETIQRLTSRTISVTEDRLKALQETERLDLEEFEVMLDLRILCEVCGTQYRIGQLLDGGGCDCQRES